MKSIKTDAPTGKIVRLHMHFIASIMRRTDDNQTSISVFHWVNPQLPTTITNFIMPKTLSKIFSERTKIIKKAISDGYIDKNMSYDF